MSKQMKFQFNLSSSLRLTLDRWLFDPINLSCEVKQLCTEFRLSKFTFESKSCWPYVASLIKYGYGTRVSQSGNWV